MLVLRCEHAYPQTTFICGGEQVYCLALSHHNHAIDEQIGFRLDLDHLVLFPRI